MVKVPLNWHDMSNNEKKAWAEENGLAYEFKTSGLPTGNLSSKKVSDLEREKADLETELENAKTKLTIINTTRGIRISCSLFPQFPPFRPPEPQADQLLHPLDPPVTYRSLKLPSPLPDRSPDNVKSSY